MSAAPLSRPQPANGVARVTPYSVAPVDSRIDLRLDGNEGVLPPPALLDVVSELGPRALRDYPHATDLEAVLAKRFDVDPRRVVVTAGADDALDRCCRAGVGPGRGIVLPIPTFEMLERYPRLVGARITTVAWPTGPFPVAAVLDRVRPATAAIAVVTPNNPTGAVATADDLHRLAAAAPGVLLIVDLAYAEFADDDLMPTVLSLPNAVAVRTLSKAWGLAGLRVGYAVAPAGIADWLRAAGSPYPTSGLSIAIAIRRLQTGADEMQKFVGRIRDERGRLAELLAGYGAKPLASQANFVFARFADAERVRADLAAAGIAVRCFAARPGLEDALRITCPGEATAFERLCTALTTSAQKTPTAFASGDAQR